MATIKVKLRPSSVVGRAGTIYYQVTHRRATQQITTNIRLQPDEWDAIGEQVVVSVADKSIIQNYYCPVKFFLREKKLLPDSNRKLYIIGYQSCNLH